MAERLGQVKGQITMAEDDGVFAGAHDGYDGEKSLGVWGVFQDIGDGAAQGKPNGVLKGPAETSHCLLRGDLVRHG